MIDRLIFILQHSIYVHINAATIGIKIEKKRNSPPLELDDSVDDPT